MAVAVVADSHLGGPGGSAEPLVEQLLALSGERCERLLLLGDIFQFWAGDPRYETPDHARVAEVLRTLRREGLRVDYVEGNRDFFLADGPYADAFDSVVTEISFEVGGRRVLAVHGDGIDPSDRAYRFWRWLSKNALSRFFWFHLPGPLARRLASGMERRLSRTNFRHKKEIPEATVVRYGRERLAEGYDLLLLGHFHEERRWQTEEGEIYLVDAWFRSRRVEWLRS